MHRRGFFDITLLGRDSSTQAGYPGFARGPEVISLGYRVGDQETHIEGNPDFRIYHLRISALKIQKGSPEYTFTDRRLQLCEKIAELSSILSLNLYNKKFD